MVTLYVKCHKQFEIGCGGILNKILLLYKKYFKQSTVARYIHNVTCTFYKKFHAVFRNGHMMTHRSKKPFECKVEGCDKSYCDSRSLRRHLENHHQHNLETVAAAVAAGVDISTGTSFFQFDMPPHRSQPSTYHQDGDSQKSPGYLQQVSPISPAAGVHPRQAFEQLEYVYYTPDRPSNN